MDYNKLEEYVCSELRKYNELKEKTLSEEKQKVEKLQGAVYKIIVDPYCSTTEEDIQKLRDIYNQYNLSRTGLDIDVGKLLNELSHFGFKIRTYPYITEFKYLDRYWLVHTDDYYSLEFKVVEHDYRTYFTKYSMAVAKIFEEAYKFLERKEKENEK